MKSLNERIDSSEKKVKQLAKEKTPSDPELNSARRKLFDHICEFVKASEDDDDSLIEKAWRLCFLKRIEDFRSRIDTEAKGHTQRKIVQEFKVYLTESTRLLRDFADNLNDKPHVLSRLYSCIGDLSRYKESVSSEGDRRWIEAEGYYRQAAKLWPESGLPQNQLAVLAYYKKRKLVAVYRYERALACTKPFENARKNLKSLFQEVCKSPAENPTLHEQFFDDMLKLQYFILAPDDPIEETEADQIVASLIDRFRSDVQSNNFKGEVLTALLLTFAFVISNGDVFERPVGNTKKANLALRAFRSIVWCYLEKATIESDAGAGDSGNDAMRATFAKSLFHVCFICDFVRAFGFHLLDDVTKAKFEEVDRSIANFVKVRGQGVALGGLIMTPDESELLGFLPLPQLAGRQLVTEIDTNTDLVVKGRRIRTFVAEFVEADLRSLSADGAIFSTHNQEEEYQDEEEEEILFRPAFSVPARSTPVPQNPALFGLDGPTGFQPSVFPSYFPFTGSFQSSTYPTVNSNNPWGAGALGTTGVFTHGNVGLWPSYGPTNSGNQQQVPLEGGYILPNSEAKKITKKQPPPGFS